MFNIFQAKSPLIYSLFSLFFILSHFFHNFSEFFPIIGSKLLFPLVELFCNQQQQIKKFRPIKNEQLQLFFFFSFFYQKYGESMPKGVQ